MRIWDLVGFEPLYSLNELYMLIRHFRQGIKSKVVKLHPFYSLNICYFYTLMVQKRSIICSYLGHAKNTSLVTLQHNKAMQQMLKNI